MSTFDPKNPQMSSINLGARVSKPLRSIMSSGSRLMSNNKFIKTMRTKMAESGKMSDKLARKVSLRAAVGVKELGLDTRAHKHAFTEGMQEEGMLGVAFKHNPKMALEAYKHAAEIAHPVTNTHSNEVPVSDHKTTHDRMQKIRDDIERQKHEQQEQETNHTDNLGAETKKTATTSITHVVSGVNSAPIVDPEIPESPIHGSAPLD